MLLAIYAVIVTLLLICVSVAYVGQARMALEAQAATVVALTKLNTIEKGRTFILELEKTTTPGHYGVYGDQTRNIMVAWKHCADPGEVRDACTAVRAVIGEK